MSEPEHQQRASELSRLWQGQVVPVEDESTSALQRARTVPSIGVAIAQAAMGRRRKQRLRKLVAALSVAASVAGVAFAARYAWDQHSNGLTAAHESSSGVRALAGTVTLVNSGGPSTIVQSSIEVGDALSTTADGLAELKLSDLVLAEIGGASELSVVTPTASAHRLRLDRGHISAKVNDRPSAAPKLVVETPNVDVVVTGTIFQVDVTPGRGPMEFVTTVSVTKGRVVVRHGTQQVAAITAGGTWTSARETASRGPESQASPTPASRPARSPVVAARPPHPGTLAEENSLFQTAVDARNHGDDRSEADHLGALLNRFPGSPLAGEARVERMRALQRTGQAAEAAREARRYLAENPDGFARDEARRIVMQDGAAPHSAQ
ncbi:MAG TPA: FecR family protein [Polyangiaceae bacterium]|nr:FecR family protein [Polyangiaceae bacterium]